MTEEKKWYDDLPMEDRLTIANNILKGIMSEEEYEKFCELVKKLKS